MAGIESEAGFHFIHELSLEYPFENEKYSVRHAIYSSHHSLNINPEQDLIGLGKGIAGTCEKCPALRDIAPVSIGKMKGTKDLTIECSLLGNGKDAFISVYKPYTIIRDAVDCPLQRTGFLTPDQ